MLNQFLKIFAPNSLHLLFNPPDTGSPNYDLNTHLEQYANKRDTVYCPTSNSKLRLLTGNITRIDLESLQLIGGRVLGHLESDLGPVDEAEQQHKILAVPYAQKKLDNIDNAVEFVKVIKQAVSAGVDADPRSLQIWASWAYNEINLRHAQLLQDNSQVLQETKSTPRHAQLVAELKAEAIKHVLSQLAITAMHLIAVTASNDDRLLDEPEIHPISPREETLTAAERRDLFETRCNELLDTHEPRSHFAAELTAICARIGSATSSTSTYDDEAGFQSYLSDLCDSGTTTFDTLEAIQESHERLEQYSEDGLVSLHMSDAERFVVDGNLDDDVDADYLPPEARTILNEVHQLFINGAASLTIYEHIESSLNQIYGDPKDEANRVIRTKRAAKTRPTQTRFGIRHKLYEYTYPVSVYPNQQERQYTREVLEILIQAMQKDFILMSMNHSSEFRRIYRHLDEAKDVGELVATIKDAYQSRLKHTITIKMFTALNTLYQLKRARLQSTPLRVYKTVNGITRLFEPAIPLIALAKTIKAPDLRILATRIHLLPPDERERVRRIFQSEQPELYKRVLDGLLGIIRDARPNMRRRLRFACYHDWEKDTPNQAHNMIHLMTASDYTRIWKQLKEIPVQFAA